MGNDTSKNQQPKRKASRKFSRKDSAKEQSPKAKSPSAVKPVEPQLSAEEIAKREKRAKQRQRAVNELLSTERTYVRLLELCIEHFMIPLDPTTRGNSPSLSQSVSTRGKTNSTIQKMAPTTPKTPSMNAMNKINENDTKLSSNYSTDTNNSNLNSNNTNNNANNPNNTTNTTNSSNNNNNNSSNNNGYSTPNSMNSGMNGLNGLNSSGTMNLLNITESFPNAHKIMSSKHHRLLFSDLKMIYGLNQSFLQGLEAIIDGGNWDAENARLSAPFEQFIPFFTMYQNYLNNYEAANECYTEYSTKNTSFIQFENYARNLCDGQNLQSLIILPIQRLPRYKLLLSEILKNTETFHIDYNSLKLCLNRIDATAKLLNERMKEYEARAKVRKIERRFIYTSKDSDNNVVSLVKPHRSFVKEGKLFKVDRKGQSVENVFLLFSDILIYASEINKINKTSNMKDMIAYTSDIVSSGGASSNDITSINETKLRLKQILPIDSVFSIKDIKEENAKFGNRGFEIYSSVKSFIVYAAQSYEKDAWIKTLNEVIEKQRNVISNRQSNAEDEKSAKNNENSENNGTNNSSNDNNNNSEKKRTSQLFAAPLLIPDDYSDVCMRCGVKFTAINRRHHCRYCGFIICGKCGKNQLASRRDRTKVVKLVCNQCFQQYKEIYPKPKSGAVLDDSDNEQESDDENNGNSKGPRTSTVSKFRTSILKVAGK